MLHEMFIGKQMKQIPAPAVVLDLAVVERNCTQMLETCKVLEVDFRPHMKTHKVRSLFGNDGGKRGFLISLAVELAISFWTLPRHINTLCSVGVDSS